ncbi:V-type proton ATPase subunit B [Labeo rohita]|uniref:V-type proton ATPase subunit B n=1 Tax=Labeo rohita TaxID=84645 RepID=A0ABQ8MXT3_LABRO|nr:V-type proton ATPase subunit B [Labeo rohita]
MAQHSLELPSHHTKQEMHKFPAFSLVEQGGRRGGGSDFPFLCLGIEDNQTPPSSLFQTVEVHEQSLGWWELGGDFLPSPPPAEEITPCYDAHKLQQGRMVRARESTADERLPSTALTATSCFASQPNPPTVPLFTAERLPSFSSRANMHPVSRLSFPVFSLHFSHISLFSLCFSSISASPPSLRSFALTRGREQPVHHTYPRTH